MLRGLLQRYASGFASRGPQGCMFVNYTTYGCTRTSQFLRSATRRPSQGTSPCLPVQPSSDSVSQAKSSLPKLVVPDPQTVHGHGQTRMEACGYVSGMTRIGTRYDSRSTFHACLTCMKGWGSNSFSNQMQSKDSSKFRMGT